MSSAAASAMSGSDDNGWPRFAPRYPCQCWRSVEEIPVRLRLSGCLVTLVLHLVVALCAAAAPAHVPRIGVLSQFAPPAPTSAAFEGFRAGLRELGNTEGRNIALEYRYAEGDYARLAPLATALVRLPVDILVALSPPAIQAAVQATATLPIVGIGVPTRPAANVTGVDTGAEAFRQTWHALLTEALPGASRVALLWDATLGPPPSVWAKAAARVMGIHLQPLMVACPDAFARVVAAAAAGRADVLLIPESELFHQSRTEIAALAVLLIGAWANGHCIPNDALLDLEDDRKERKQLEKFLRKEARKLAGQQQRKADSVIKVAQALLGAAHPNI